MPRLKYFILLFVFSLFGFSEYSYATAQRQDSKWAISIDNDLLSPISTSDEDFTGGFAFTYSGNVKTTIHKVLNNALRTVDGITIGVSKKRFTSTSASFELGLYGFTPADVEQKSIVQKDRPYASLFYASAGRSYLKNTRDSGWATTFSVGVLGLDLFGTAQNELHRLIGSDSANGWAHQISDGGELTLRYQLAYMNYWSENDSPIKLKTTYFSSVGYIAEMGMALSTVSGMIADPGSRFNPELISYGEKVNDIALDSRAIRKRQFWAGVAIKARVYNAFLQGQFKRSAYTVEANDLEIIIYEAWLGYTFQLMNQYNLSYILRWQSPEIRRDEGGREMIWGALVLSHSF